MPLGITESTLRRAYGPLDLSYSYQRLEATQKLLAAEEKAKREELAKQYYTDMAALKKDFGSVRQEDIGEITRKYNRWSQLSKQLSMNPNLISKNGELYGKLKGEADTLFGEVLGDIGESKEMKKMLYDTGEKLGDVRNFDVLEEGAFNKFKEQALYRPTKELVKSGMHSFNNYLSPILDGTKFTKTFGDLVQANAIKREASFDDPTFKDRFGRTRKITLKDVPLAPAMYTSAVTALQDTFKGRAGTYATQRLDELGLKGQQDIIDKYNNIYEDAKKKYGVINPTAKEEDKIANFIGEKLVIKPEEGVSQDGKYNLPKSRLAKLVAMTEFMDKFNKMSEVPEDAKLGDVESILFRQRLEDASRKREMKDLLSLPNVFGDAVAIITKMKDMGKLPVGKNVALDGFSADMQEIAVNRARALTKANDWTPKQLSLNYNPTKNEIEIFSRTEMKDADESVMYKPGDLLASVSAGNVAAKVARPYGVKAVRETAPKSGTWADRYKKK